MKDFKDLADFFKGFVAQTPTDCKHVFIPNVHDPGQFICKLCNVTTRKSK